MSLRANGLNSPCILCGYRVVSYPLGDFSVALWVFGAMTAELVGVWLEECVAGVEILYMLVRSCM